MNETESPLSRRSQLQLLSSSGAAMPESHLGTDRGRKRRLRLVSSFAASDGVGKQLAKKQLQALANCSEDEISMMTRLCYAIAQAGLGLGYNLILM